MHRTPAARAHPRVSAFRGCYCYSAGGIERDAETAVDFGEEELPRGLSAGEEIPG